MNNSTKINIAGVDFKNPVMVCSGTFGSGLEYAGYMDINCLGAVVTKGVSNVPWEGNPPVRTAETPSGMLNAIGLQNPGMERFAEDDLPALKDIITDGDIPTRIIVNICGHSVKDYCEVAEYLSDKDIDMFEVNISCPNVKEGGVAFGRDPHQAAIVTEKVKKYSKKPIIVKLSPNVTDISEIARAVEDAGADALSLINTITGMKIDIDKRAPVLANITGGLSGPAIRPIAVRMVYETAKAVNIPIIGMGGIMNASDALEFIMAGATAISVGTASFNRPDASKNVADGIYEYIKYNEISRIQDLIGVIQ